MNRQAELINKMTDRQVILNVYMTQGFLGALSIFLGFVFFRSWQKFYDLFVWNPVELLVVGCGSAGLIIIINLILIKLVEEKHYDDGGINRRIFSVLPVWHIWIVTMIISIVEEILFRGILQTHIGYIAASMLFVLMHIRYLKKPLLLIMAVLLSLFLGFLFLKTSNLNVTIIAHFLIDFILGCMIRFKYKKSVFINEKGNKEVVEYEGSSKENR